MTMTDTTEMRERIARALWDASDGAGMRLILRPDTFALADVVLQIVAPEALKERAEDFRTLAHELIDGKDPEMDPRIFDPWDVAELLERRARELEGTPS